MKHAKNRTGGATATLTALLCAMIFIGCGGVKMGNGEMLTASAMEQLKRDYLEQIIKPLDLSISLENLEIERVYGVFDEHVVVRFNTVIGFPSVVTPIEIGGVMIDWNFAFRIIAWKDSQVFTLISAQEKNILSQENLREIVLLQIKEGKTK
ncbi:MAG: hypothetical protein FWC97_03060 [Treponema sp.]|nr:hypothetical protein [Treponema sp.]